ncbi:MAG: NUDIX hydrolase [Chloroflexi bacterium]|nr:NUDIX hydrolase [Chloroflexota bacterium]
MKRKNARVAWEGRSWRFWAEEWVIEDGSVVERGRIQHPGAVVIIPYQDREVLMLNQYRFTLEQTILECPAGTREWDEDWLACAQRELREETGYRAERLEPLGQAWPAPGVTDEVMAFYLARDLTYDPLPADADEQIEVQAYPLADLVQMALDGRLVDGKSVIGVLRAAAFLGNLKDGNY